MQNNSKITTHSSLYFIPFMLASAYVALGMNIQGIFAMLPIISEEFDLSRAQAGLFSSFYFLSATIVAVFSGRLIDIIGSHKGLILGIGGFGLVMFATAFSPVYGIMLAFAFLCGIVFSVVTPSVSRGIMEHSPPERRAISMGIAHSGGGVGGMLGAALLPVIATHYSWRVALLCSASLAVGIAFFIRFYYPKDEKKAADDSCGHQNGLKHNIKGLLSNRYFLSVCILAVLFGSVASSVGAHYALFLHGDFHLSPVKAGLGLAVLQIGGVCGMSGWGIISDKFMWGNRAKTLCLLASSMAAVALFIGLFGPLLGHSYLFILIIALITGFTTLGTMAILFTTVTEAVGESRAGMGTGVALIFSRTGVILGPPVFGRIADMTDTYRHSWLSLGSLAVVFAVAFFIASKKYAGEAKDNTP